MYRSSTYPRNSPSLACTSPRLREAECSISLRPYTSACSSRRPPCRRRSQAGSNVASSIGRRSSLRRTCTLRVARCTRTCCLLHKPANNSSSSLRKRSRRWNSKGHCFRHRASSSRIGRSRNCGSRTRRNPHKPRPSASSCRAPDRSRCRSNRRSCGTILLVGCSHTGRWCTRRRRRSSRPLRRRGPPGSHSRNIPTAGCSLPEVRNERSSNRRRSRTCRRRSICPRGIVLHSTCPRRRRSAHCTRSRSNLSQPRLRSPPWCRATPCMRPTTLRLPSRPPTRPAASPPPSCSPS